MSDLSWEREFTLTMAQARKLLNDNKPGDALVILDPLKDKYSDKAEYLDLLGASYATAGFLQEAREVFTRALDTPPTNKYRDALNRYNLVKLCAKTGSPFIAYEYSRNLNCELVAEAARVPGESYRCQILKGAVRDGIAKLARAEKMPFEDYVKYSLLLDKGRLEMNGSEKHWEAGLVTFQQATKLNPKSTTTYNNLAIIYLWQGKLEQALEQVRYLLEKVDPNHVHALSNIIRLLFSLNQPEEAESYLKRLLAIKINPGPDLVKLAEALIYFKRDQEIYEKIQRLNHDEKLFSVLQMVDKPASEQAVIFEVVAAANAGNRKRATEIAWAALGLFETHQQLLERTYEALKNNESGPMPDGRFIYWEPKAMYPQAAQGYKQVNQLLLNLPQPDAETARYETVLKPFFAEFGHPALDYVAYLYWMNHEPEKLNALLTQTLKCGATGTVELVKRLAFEQTGTEKQRLAALTALVEAGLVGIEEKVTFWVEQQSQTVTLAQLQQRPTKS